MDYGICKMQKDRPTSDAIASTSGALISFGKDFGCIHWKGEQRIKGDGDEYCHIEMMTNKITWAKNPEWIGQIYDEAKHRPQDELKENP